MLTTLLAFANTIAIIPQPSIVIPQPGGFDLNAQTVISADKGLANVATRLREYWKTGTGLELPNGNGTSNVIRIKLDSKANLALQGQTKASLQATAVEVAAKSKFSAKAAQVDLAADATFAAQGGAEAKLGSNAMVEIKAALVKIN